MKPISADSHVMEAEDVFIGLPERFGDDAPRVMNVGTEQDAIVIPSKGSRGIRKRMGWAGMRIREGVALERRPGHKPEVDDLTDAEAKALLAQGYNGLRPGIRDGSQRGADQDVDGVEAEFLYPGFFGMFSFQNTDLLVACQRNYNDWLYDYAGAADGRLFGLAAIPLQDPAAGLAELERVIKKGYKGGCIPCTSPVDRPYFDDCYEPIWSLAEQAGFPLSMHVGTNTYIAPEHRSKNVRRDSVFDYANTPSTVQRTLVELMCRGVAERHPTLKFVVSEFNAGWIGFWLNRVDQGLQREQRFKNEAFTGERPIDVWKRQFYATIEDDRPAVVTRELIGVDNLMWGSDYPHVDSTWPCSLDVLDEIFVDVPDDERAKITRENVKALYGV
ncbi:MAG: amidohydrolase family protein [Gammaproteobacteria bacterium]|nr:amidohydrolase family protein [Gammaproteobacteria bacterium]